MKSNIQAAVLGASLHVICLGPMLCGCPTVILQMRTRVLMSLRSTAVDHPSLHRQCLCLTRKLALLRYRRYHAANVGSLASCRQQPVGAFTTVYHFLNLCSIRPLQDLDPFDSI